MLTLRDYQVADMAFYISQRKCMNLSDPGTGKTPSVNVNQFRRWRDEDKATVWVQPKSLCGKNVEEICRFTPFTTEDVVIVDGTPAKIKKALNKDAKILLMGPDRFKASFRDLAANVQAIDVDEFHLCFGGATSQRTTAFQQFCRWRDPDMVLMTGTLIHGRLDTAYPAIEAIEPRYYPFGYDQFLGSHAYLDDYGRPIAWHSHEKLREIMGRHGIRRTFNDVFGAQEIVFETQWLELNDKQREIHDKFKADAFVELDNFIIDGTLPGPATTRARQIMEHPNHFPDLTKPDEKVYVDIINGERPAKLDALEIIFADHLRAKTPFVLFAFFVPQQRQIAELATKMGLKVAVLNGSASGAERTAADVAFRAGQLDGIIGSPGRVTSVGWNWQFRGDQEVCHIIMASLGYMDTDFNQGWRRAVRGVRKNALRVTTLAYRSEVERKVMEIVRRKSEDANKVDPTQDLITFNSWKEIPMTNA